MRYPKRKLVLFLAMQAFAVSAMISLSLAKRHSVCPVSDDCTPPSAASVTLSVLLILGELGLIGSALAVDRPAWRSLLGFGVLFLATALFCALSAGMYQPHHVLNGLAAWHLVIALLLLGTGTAAGVWDLLAKLRRPDRSLPEDQTSSGMWPLD